MAGVGVVTNAWQFEIQVVRFGDLVGERANLARRRLALGIYRRATIGTPVRTGRLRANWNISVGYPNDFTVPPVKAERDEAGNYIRVYDDPPITSTALLNLAKLTERQDVWINNSTEYAYYVEAGTDRMVGRYMLKMAVEQEAAEFNSMMRIPEAT